MPPQGQRAGSELPPVLRESGVSSGTRGPKQHGEEASGFQDQHTPPGKPCARTPGSQRRGWALPLHACTHARIGAQVRVSAQPGSSLFPAQPSHRQCCQGGDVRWKRLSPCMDRGQRSEAGHGSRNLGSLKTAVRKKQSGREPSARVWVGGSGGRTKPASKLCCLAGAAGNVLSLLRISLCPADPWARGEPSGVPGMDSRVGHGQQHTPRGPASPPPLPGASQGSHSLA